MPPKRSMEDLEAVAPMPDTGLFDFGLSYHAQKRRKTVMVVEEKIVGESGRLVLARGPAGMRARMKMLEQELAEEKAGKVAGGAGKVAGGAGGSAGAVAKATAIKKDTKKKIPKDVKMSEAKSARGRNPVRKTRNAMPLASVAEEPTSALPHSLLPEELGNHTGASLDFSNLSI
jgi:hypothetical protein